MKYKKRNENNEEISYWESMTDLMSALILIVLLVFALVLLYIVRTPESEYKDLFEGDSYESADADYREYDPEEDHDPEDDYDDYEHYEYEHDSGNGGGGGYEEHEYDHEYDYEYPGLVDDDGKTAVHVTVIDAETENPIKLAGTEFQLFRQGDIMQILCSYYPARVEYNKYATTKDGTFFLPEKIPGGSYYLHELTAPEGYDLSENVGFWTRESQDWPEPMEITIPLYPSRNVVRINVRDSISEEGVSGGEYDVIASEDIITYDGTLRYEKGQVVDHIRCDENGHGESSELYLGTYQLMETSIPEYYAGDSKPLSVSLEKKGTKAEKDKIIAAEKSRVTYLVRDELDQTTPVSGAVFYVLEKGKTTGRKTYKTDEDGSFEITDLEKDKTYQITQTSAPQGYRWDEEERSFTVSEDGLIDGEASAAYDLYNRILRIKISVRAALLGVPESDVGAALYNEKDELVHRWDSSGVPEEITGIDPGIYKVVLRGDSKKPKMIEVKDQAEEQSFSVTVWTNSGIAVVGILILVLLLLVFWIIRNKGKKRNTEIMQVEDNGEEE